MVQITEKAQRHIQHLMQEEKRRPESDFLRVRVQRGGCSGFSYKLAFDDQAHTQDQVFEHKGLRLVIDEKSMLYVLGMTLDYEGGLNGQGFVFQNPNASKKCGCGSSFAV